eukprot:9472393-Pyramimonas_sp.AAC.1
MNAGGTIEPLSMSLDEKCPHSASTVWMLRALLWTLRATVRTLRAIVWTDVKGNSLVSGVGDLQVKPRSRQSEMDLVN